MTTRTVTEMEEEIAQLRARVPGIEAAIAEIAPKVQPAYDRWMELRAITEAAGAARLRTGQAMRETGGEDPGYLSREQMREREADRARREQARRVAAAGWQLARDEEHAAQKAYNALSVRHGQLKTQHQQFATRLASVERELARAQRRTATQQAATAQARGWLDGVRAKLAGAA